MIRLCQGSDFHLLILCSSSSCVRIACTWSSCLLLVITFVHFVMLLWCLDVDLLAGKAKTINQCCSDMDWKLGLICWRQEASRSSSDPELIFSLLVDPSILRAGFSYWELLVVEACVWKQRESKHRPLIFITENRFDLTSLSSHNTKLTKFNEFVFDIHVRVWICYVPHFLQTRWNQLEQLCPLMFSVINRFH